MRAADIKKIFSKEDSANCRNKIHTKSEVIYEIFPIYRIDYLPKRFNQNFLISTKLSLEEKDQILKELDLFQRNHW